MLTFSTYDGLNRVTGKLYSLGLNVQPTPPVSYVYGDTQSPGCNLKGRLMQVTAGNMVNTYCYQWAGKPTSNTQSTNGTTYPALMYGYDLALEQTSLTFPSGRVQTTNYDNGGRVSSATAVYNAIPTTYSTSYAYFPNGALTNVTLGPSAQVQQYCQNSRLQISGVRLSAAHGATQNNCTSSNDLLNLSLTYGAANGNNGNLTTEQILKPLNTSETFTYDAYNRISTASEGTGPAWSQTYNYDQYGNRWVASVNLSLYSFTPTSSAAYNSSNRLTTQFNTNMAYDNAGNETGIGGYLFTYDAENRQYSSSIGGSTTYYTYDGEGRRVMKSTPNGTTTVYVYDASGEVAAEYSSTPPPQIGTLYLTPDHLGSTRIETNEVGAPVWYHDYLPFGEELLNGTGGRGSLYGVADADGTTHKFTGKERDSETGLDYFGARYFSSAQGRFTSPDKPLIGQQEIDPQSWNLYTYVRNNPLRYTDPDGLDYHVCVDNGKGGQSCVEMNDAQYKALYDQQNGKQGVGMPIGMPGGAITCGGSVCGSATYYENWGSMGRTSFSIGLGFFGGKAVSAGLSKAFGWVAGLFGRAGTTAATTTATDVLVGRALTGFSEAQQAMIQRSLTALEAAGYNTGRLQSLIRISDAPAGYVGMSLSDGAALSDEAFASQAMLNHSLEHELIHMEQTAQGLRTAYGPGTAEGLEKGADVQAKFPAPPHQ